MTRYEALLRAIDSEPAQRPAHGFDAVTVGRFHLAADDVLESFNEYLNHADTASKRQTGKHQAVRDVMFSEQDTAFADVGDGLCVAANGIMSFGIRMSFWRGGKPTSVVSPIRSSLKVGEPETVPPFIESDSAWTTRDLDIIMWLPGDEGVAVEARAALRVEGTRYGVPALPPNKGDSRGLVSLFDRITKDIIAQARRT